MERIFSGAQQMMADEIKWTAERLAAARDELMADGERLLNQQGEALERGRQAFSELVTRQRDHLKTMAAHWAEVSDRQVALLRDAMGVTRGQDASS